MPNIYATLSGERPKWRRQCPVSSVAPLYEVTLVQGLLFPNLSPTHIPASSLSTSAPDSRWQGIFFVFMPFGWNSCNNQTLTLTVGSILLWSLLWLILHRLDFSALLTSELDLWEPMLEVSYLPLSFPRHFPKSLLSFLHMSVFLQRQILPSLWCNGLLVNHGYDARIYANLCSGQFWQM